MLGRTRTPPSGERRLYAVAPPAKRRLNALAPSAMRREGSCVGLELIQKLTEATGPGEYYARRSAKFAKLAAIWNDERLGGVFHVAYGKYGTSPAYGLAMLFVPLNKGRYCFLPEPKLRAVHARSDRVLGGRGGELIEVEDRRIAVEVGTNRDKVTVHNYVPWKQGYFPQANLKMALGEFVNLVGLYMAVHQDWAATILEVSSTACTSRIGGFAASQKRGAEHDDGSNHIDLSKE